MATTNETVDIRINASQANAALQSIDKNVNRLATDFREFILGIGDGMKSAHASTKKFADQTTELTKNTGKLNASTNVLSGSFANLGSIIAGIGIGAMITNALNLATTISQVNSATGIAVGTIKAFSDAVAANGGQTQEATERIIEFVAVLSDARKGSTQAQMELAKVGITLDDLSKLSEEDIFKKTIQGLAELEDASIRNQLAIKLLGENFKKADIKKVAADFAKTPVVDSSSTVAAAGAMKNLTIAMNQLQQKALDALKPITEFISKLSPEQIDKATTAIIEISKNIVVLVGAVQGLRVVGSILTAVGAGFAYVAASAALVKTGIVDIASSFRRLGIVTGAVAKLFKGYWEATATYGWSVLKRFSFIITDMYQLISSGVGRVFAGLATAIGTLAKGLLRFAGVFGVILAAVDAVFQVLKLLGIWDGWKALGDGWDYVTGKIKGAVTEVTKYMRLHPSQKQDSVGGGRGGQGGPSAAEMAAYHQRIEMEAELARLKKKTTAEVQKTKYVYDAIGAAVQQQRYEIQQTLSAYVTNNRLNREALQLQASLVGKTEEQVQMAQALNAIDADYYNQLRSIEQKYLDLQQAARNANKEDPAGVEAMARFADFAKNRAQLEAKLRGEYVQQREAVGDLVDQIVIAQNKERGRLAIVEQTKQRYQDQIDAVEGLRKALGDLSTENRKTFENTMFDRSQMGRGDIAKQIAQIKRDAEELVKSQTAALEAAAASATDPAIWGELQDAIKQVTDEINRNRDASLENLGVSRSWATGWSDAFENYKERATDAASTAREVFNAMTSSIESAIDNMIDNGKFKWSEFRNNIVRELLKIYAKNALRNLISGMDGVVATIGDKIKGAFSNKDNVLSPDMNASKAVFGSLFDWIKSSASGVWNWVSNAFSKGIDVVLGVDTSSIKSAVSGVWNWIGNLFTKGKDLVLGVDTSSIKSSISGVWNWIGNLFTKGKDLVLGVDTSSIKSAVSGVWNWIGNLFTKGKDLVLGVDTSNIFSSFGKFFDWVGSGIGDITGALKNFFNVQGPMNQLGRMFTRLFDTIGDSLSDVGSMLMSVVRQLMSGIGSSGGGIISAIGSLFGGFFANGGQPPVGKTSVVGERGPELFVPKVAGTIIPNDQLRSLFNFDAAKTTGTNQVVNNYYYNTYDESDKSTTNNINAVDAKSVAQLFAENRRTLLGAVSQAEKEMPVRGMRGRFA
jgi:hypothetical protein